MRPKLLIWTALAALCVLSIAGAANAAHGERFMIVCNQISGGICTQTKVFRGVKANVSLHHSYTSSPFSGIAFATVRLERRGGGGLVQAGPARLWKYGQFGCPGLHSGARIIVERKSPTRWWNQGVGTYRCELYAHPTGDLTDPVAIKIIQTSTPFGDVFSAAVNGNFVYATADAGQGSAEAMAQGGFNHGIGGNPDYVWGRFSQFRTTKHYGDVGWTSTSATAGVFEKCFPGSIECSSAGMDSFRSGSSSAVFALGWKEN